MDQGDDRTITSTATAVSRRALESALRVGDLGLRLLRVRQSEAQLMADAQRYWAADGAGEDLAAARDEYHWRGGEVIDDERFLRLGAEHLAIFERLAGASPQLGRVIEWGAGGGANAIAFAPRADEFVAVDVVPAAPPECARQVAAVCDTPVVERVVAVEDPEAVLATLPGPCDLFLCTYVIELLPSPQYARRLLRIAAALLAPGGLALVQFRYDAGGARQSSRRYGYRLNPATMTTFRVEEFWGAALEAGLEPQVMTLVPRNDIDERYAYVLLRRP